jgi:hypothetical protein
VSPDTSLRSVLEVGEVTGIAVSGIAGFLILFPEDGRDSLDTDLIELLDSEFVRECEAIDFLLFPPGPFT